MVKIHTQIPKFNDGAEIDEKKSTTFLNIIVTIRLWIFMQIQILSNTIRKTELR